MTSALAPGYSGKSLDWIDGSRADGRVKHLIGTRNGVEVTDPHTIERARPGKMRRIINHRESR